MSLQHTRQALEHDAIQPESFGRERLQAALRELVINGSIEIRNNFSESLEQARGELPFGMRIYIRSLHGQDGEVSLERIRALHAAGFDPVPHIAARRIRARSELRVFLQAAVQESGVSRVLVIGGDLPAAQGPYADAGAVLRDGVLQEAGIREIGLAAYPEGHADVPRESLSAILLDKLRVAASAGLGTYVVTQFSFVPARITDFCASLSRLAPETSVYVGLAGPASPEQLARYAKICGVSTSIRALTDLGFKAASMVRYTEPDTQLEAVARYCMARGDACNVTGIHVYSFGGFMKSSQWMYRLYCK
jgi:methylenetetrahydrofolate reductase (NADPH)